MVIVYRHKEYNKFIVTIEKNYSVIEFVLYDISVSELGEFIRSMLEED